MAGSMNGALLALGVVGAVALAGRVRRGSFAHGWHGRARELLNAAADEQYVDSGDLIEVLEAIKDDHSVTGRTRARVVSLLLGSQDEGYLDSGEAMEAIEAALGHGSRAIYGMSPDAAGRTLRLGSGKPRSHAGEALNDYRWHPQRALAQFAVSKKKGKGKGGSRAFLLDSPDYTHYVVHVPSMKIASGWSYAEDAKEALADMGSAKAHCKVYTRKYLRDNGRDPRHNGNWASLAQFAVSKKKGKGKGGSRAFLLDSPDYTHYVVHVPSMKIASGWSYAEDAKEALSELGRDKSKFKVYTRKFLREHGHDPRDNRNWSSHDEYLGMIGRY